MSALKLEPTRSAPAIDPDAQRLELALEDFALVPAQFDEARPRCPDAVARLGAGGNEEPAPPPLDAFEAGVDLGRAGMAGGFLAGAFLEGEVGGVAFEVAGLRQPRQTQEIPVPRIVFEKADGGL